MTTVIAKIERSLYKTEITVCDHKIVSDEPVLGGQCKRMDAVFIGSWVEEYIAGMVSLLHNWFVGAVLL